MKHAYLTKKDIDVARVLKQITKCEVQELIETLNKCKGRKVIANVALHDVA